MTAGTFSLVLSAVVLISGIWGLFRGLVREIMSILTWVVAGAVSFLWAPIIANYLLIYIDYPLFNWLLSFVIILFLGLMLGSLITKLLRRIISASILGPTDKLLGLCFGSLRGIFLVFIILLTLSMTAFYESSSYRESFWTRYLSPWISSSRLWLSDRLSYADADASTEYGPDSGDYIVGDNE